VADVSEQRPIDGRIQALVLTRPIEVWTSDDATSGRAYTEQSPIAGLPVADRDSHMTLQPGGVPEGTADLQVRVQHGGVPGQIDHGATVAVRVEASPADLYLGWEQPGVITQWEGVTFTAADSEVEQDVATLPDGSLVAVARQGVDILTWRRAPDGTTWAAPATVYDGTADDRPAYWPCLCVIGDELYCLAWRRSAYGTPTLPEYYIAVWRSTDSGATWSEVQDYATTEGDVHAGAIPWGGSQRMYLGRIRAAYRDGEVLVVAHLQEDLDASTPGTGYADWIRQWSGPGLLARLDLVGTFQGGSEGWALPDVEATAAGFLVAWIGGGTFAKAAPLGSAWQPLNTATAADVADIIGARGGWTAPAVGVSALTGVGGIALAVDPMGLAVVVGSCGSTLGEPGAGALVGSYSPDGGASWHPLHKTRDPIDAIPSLIWYPDDNTAGTLGNYPTTYGATFQRGRVVVVHGWHAAVGNEDDSVGAMYLGGWSDLTMPTAEHGIRVGDRSGWGRHWLPFELPEDQAYTVTTGGTVVSVLGSALGGSQSLTTSGAGGQHYYRQTGTAAVSGLMIAMCEADVAGDLAGSLTAGECALRLRLADGSHGVEVELRITDTAVRIIDDPDGGASTLATVSGLKSGTPYTWRVGMAMVADTGADRGLQVWYRESDTHEARRWTRVGSWTLTDDNAAGGTVPHIEWGHIVASATNRRTIWRRLTWSLPSWENIADRAQWHDLDQAGGDSPALLHGRPIGSGQVYALDGWTVGGRRGPGLIGDSWSVPVSGEYEIARALTLDTPSRRIHHRTVDTSTAVIIPWAADPGRPGVEDEEHPPVMALRILANWRRGRLEYKTVAGAWTTAAVIDMRVIDGTPYTRTGRRLRCSEAGSTYLHRDEVDPAWTVEWEPDEGASVYRHPAGNAPGRWSSSTSEPRASIELQSTEAGDPTTGGDLHLWSPHATVLIEGITATAWRLWIDPAHGTADGDYRTHIMWGEAHLLALPPSWGRGFTALPGHDRAELEGGIGVRVARAPASSELRMAWDDGVDETEIGTAGEVRYVTGSTGAEPAASIGEIPRSLVRALDRQDGRPVGWVAWDRSAFGTVTLLRAHEQHWGTVEAAPDREVSLGVEGDTEVVRVGTITIRGEQ